jgi:predicted nucleotidyltransferase component of viral defense system
VALLIGVMPHVAAEECFALKGGTAINLFIRDLPRLSVDIDLTYLPLKPRDNALAEIDIALARIAGRVTGAIRGARVTTAKADGRAVKLFVRADGVQIKIEVTPVLRGCVFEPRLWRVSPRVEDRFGFAEARIVSFADLYAGKLVAALDRQHPRDFFDVRDLLANEGIGSDLRRAFLVYLISHDRSMGDVLAARRKPLLKDFVDDFEGMTEEPVGVERLEEAREAMIADLVGKMPAEHRAFLISFKEGQPDWSALGIPVAQNLPAVRWKQRNLDRLPAAKRAALVHKLRDVLGGK